MQDSGSSTGDAVATALANLQTNTALTELRLFHKKIKAAGATALGEALKTNGVLARLDLGA